MIHEKARAPTDREREREPTEGSTGMLPVMRARVIASEGVEVMEKVVWVMVTSAGRVVWNAPMTL